LEAHVRAQSRASRTPWPPARRSAAARRAGRADDTRHSRHGFGRRTSRTTRLAVTATAERPGRPSSLWLSPRRRPSAGAGSSGG